MAAEDRSFAGFVRTIQGHVVERRPGTPTVALGQKNVPGIAQSLVLEDAVVLTAEDIVHAAHQLEAVEVAGSAAARPLWVPPRYFVG